MSQLPSPDEDLVSLEYTDTMIHFTQNPKEIYAEMSAASGEYLMSGSAESELVVSIVTLFNLSSPVITHNGVWIIAAQCAA